MINRVTILGTGAMGSRMAFKLLQSGFEVAIYNRTGSHAMELVEAGASYHTTPVSSVEGADLVISMVTDDVAAKTVWFDNEVGAIHGLQEDSIAVESSTLSVNCIKHLSLKFVDKKINFLDAPVIGSRPQADAAALIYLVGGEKQILKKIEPVLSQLSSAIYHVGTNGEGMAMKLAVNGFFASQVSAISELLGWLNKSSINRTKSIELLSNLPITSLAIKGILQLMIAAQHHPLFPIKLVEKDLGYLLSHSQTEKTTMPTLEATQLNFIEAINCGLKDKNISALETLFF